MRDGGNHRLLVIAHIQITPDMRLDLTFGTAERA